MRSALLLLLGIVLLCPGRLSFAAACDRASGRAFADSSLSAAVTCPMGTQCPATYPNPTTCSDNSVWCCAGNQTCLGTAPNFACGTGGTVMSQGSPCVPPPPPMCPAGTQCPADYPNPTACSDNSVWCCAAGQTCLGTGPNFSCGAGGTVMSQGSACVAPQTNVCVCNQTGTLNYCYKNYADAPTCMANCNTYCTSQAGWQINGCSQNPMGNACTW